MPFQTVPINLTGPSYQSRSRPLSSQRTVNFYHQLAEGGKDKFTLMSFPGLKEFAFNNSAGIDRGLWVMKEVLFQVKGTTLYSIDKHGVYSTLGTIPGLDRCLMADDGINLFIVTGNKVYHYDGAVVTRVTDPEIDGAKSVDFINNQFLYTKDNFTTVSDVGDGAQASGLNIIGEETEPDDLVRDFVFETVIWRMGVRTAVAWYNSGVGSPPIDRIEGQYFQVGLAAIHSIAQTDEAFYWLGDDWSIYRASGGTKQRISTDGISDIIEKFNVVNDAIGWTFTMQSQNFYVITFPTEKRTFAVSEELGENGWFELSSGLQGDIYQGSSLANVYDKNIVSDKDNGKLYELDLSTFANDSETLLRTRVTSSINGEVLGQKGKRVQMSRLELIMETGVGLITGQGENPKIMIEASYDGGRTFAAGDWVEIGQMGEHQFRVEWFNMSSFYDMILRITASDPVPFNVYSAAIDLRLAGR